MSAALPSYKPNLTEGCSLYTPIGTSIIVSIIIITAVIVVVARIFIYREIVEPFWQR